VIPSWACADHEASEQADHFVLDDKPVLEAFRLFRNDELPEQQAAGETFQPR
jgi:gentisate 1,2-dioxygenase